MSTVGQELIDICEKHSKISKSIVEESKENIEKFNKFNELTEIFSSENIKEYYSIMEVIREGSFSNCGEEINEKINALLSKIKK